MHRSTNLGIHVGQAELGRPLLLVLGPPAEQTPRQPPERKERGVGRRDEVEGHGQTQVLADVLHVQLGARELPLRVRLELSKRELRI